MAEQVWFVTGASSGFGRAIAEAAAEAGDTVVAAVRRPQALDELCATYPGLIDPVALDVTDTSAIGPAVDGVLQRHGRIDVLVNNAGRTQVGAIEETTDDELRGLFDLHVFGPFALTRAVLPHMRERGAGAIVMMSSVGGQVVMPGFGVYCATKYALEAVADALADRGEPIRHQGPRRGARCVSDELVRSRRRGHECGEPGLCRHRGDDAALCRRRRRNPTWRPR